MSLLLQFIVAVSSTVTASGILYISRVAQKERQRIEENEERSKHNRLALYRMGEVNHPERAEHTLTQNNGGN